MNTLRVLPALPIAFSLLMSAACGDGAGDGAADDTVDCRGEAPPATKLVAHNDDDEFTEADLDLSSCEADPLPPEGECTVTVRGTVIDFKENRFMGPNDDFDLTGTKVKVYFDNQIESLDKQADVEAEADNTGRVVLEGLPCNHHVAILAHKQTRPPTTKPTIEFNFWVGDTDRGDAEFVTLSVVSYNLIPGILGFEPDTTKGIIAGRFYDCAGHYVENGALQLTQGHNEAFEPSQTVCGVGIKYFLDEWPDRNQPNTSPDGLYAAIDVPPGPVTVHMMGRLTDDGDAIEIGRTHLNALPGSIVFSDAKPLLNVE